MYFWRDKTCYYKWQKKIINEHILFKFDATKLMFLVFVVTVHLNLLQDGSGLRLLFYVYDA